MMKLNGNQKGFSLIELMVVVGIIGILAAIAVPNFQKFQAKSRQTEAKANLGGIYTSNKAFYAEWNRYFADFRHIGYAPEGNLKYNVGFSGIGAGFPVNSGYTGPGCPTPTAACNANATYINAIAYCPTTTTAASVCFAPNTLPALTASLVGGQDFTAQAAGNIDADATLDRWTINHRKEISNLAGAQDLND